MDGSGERPGLSGMWHGQGVNAMVVKFLMVVGYVGLVLLYVRHRLINPRARRTREQAGERARARERMRVLPMLAPEPDE